MRERERVMARKRECVCLFFCEKNYIGLAKTKTIGMKSSCSNIQEQNFNSILQSRLFIDIFISSFSSNQQKTCGQDVDETDYLFQIKVRCILHFKTFLKLFATLRDWQQGYISIVVFVTAFSSN